MAKKKKSHGPANHTFNDVLYRHGGKLGGSLTLLILGLVALLRTKPEDIPGVIETIFSSDSFCWMGWIFAVLILFFALIFGVIMWRVYPRELERVCQERNKLQEKLLGISLQHSGRDG